MIGPVRTTLFKSNRTQAVRLPKALAFPEDVSEVIVLREGDRVVIIPADKLWDDFFDRPGVPDWPDRDQPPMQVREGW